jgi:LPXTG-motif cell wall-anchored protein
LEAGTYTLTAVGETSGRTQSATVTAASPQAASVSAAEDSLPETGAGANLYLWGGIGAAALLLGTTSVVIVRKKAKTEETA